jgi:transmembrane sensor
MTADREAEHDSAAALEREAIVWLTRVTDEAATSMDRAALLRWQAQSHAHAAAYAKVSKLWQAMPSAIETVVRDGSVSVPVKLAGSARAVGRRAILGGFATASAAAAGYVIIRPPLNLWPSVAQLTADYRTGTGQQRQITIVTAVQVEMNTQTSIVLRPGTPEIDRFELISGEAVVGVSARAAKPVQVVAAGGRTTADGADFDIRCDAGAVSVICLAGTVHVQHHGQSATLQQRQQVSYNARGFGPVALVDPVSATAWRDGYLMFRNEPLALVVTEVNRYRPGRIILLDAELGRGEVTARFRLDRLDDVIAQVHDVFGAAVRTLPGGLVLLG